MIDKLTWVSYVCASLTGDSTSKAINAGVSVQNIAVLCAYFFFCKHFASIMKDVNLLSFILSECNAAIHKKCIDKIIGRCTGTAANSRDTMVCICAVNHVLYTVGVLHISQNFNVVGVLFIMVLTVSPKQKLKFCRVTIQYISQINTY